MKIKRNKINQYMAKKEIREQEKQQEEEIKQLDEQEGKGEKEIKTRKIKKK